MVSAAAAAEVALLTLGVVLVVCQALENTTTALRGRPVAAAVRSHFNNCPDAHSQFCFHGTCRFLVEEEKPTCKCHSGFIGARCEHADLLAVVAATQKKQTITALVVVAVVASVLFIAVCVLMHCCQIQKRCDWCRTVVCRHEKPAGLLKGATSCCHSETGANAHALATFPGRVMKRLQEKDQRAPTTRQFSPELQIFPNIFTWPQV